MSAEKVKPVKDEVIQDSDDDDNVPIAVAAKKKQQKALPQLPKKEPKQEPFADEEGSLSDLKKKKVKGASSANKEVANGNLKPVKEEKKSSDVKLSKVKKEEDDAYETPSLKKKKKLKEELKRVKEELSHTSQKARKQADGKKEKKAYNLPGQKHDPPPERDPLRIFYESLYEQVPNSEMAAIWMMEWGLLPVEKAAKVFEMKKGRQQVLKSPVKLAAKSIATIQKKAVKVTPKEVKKESSVKTVTKMAKKQKADDTSSDENDDDDFVPIAACQKKKSAKVTPKEVKKESSVKTLTKTAAKRKAEDTSSDEGDDDDDDFIPLGLKKVKKKLKMSD